MYSGWYGCKLSRILNSFYSTTQTHSFLIQFLCITEQGPTVYPSDTFTWSHSGFLLLSNPLHTFNYCLQRISQIFLLFCMPSESALVQATIIFLLDLFMRVFQLGFPAASLNPPPLPSPHSSQRVIYENIIELIHSPA